MLEGPPGHCGVSTQSKCRCQSSEKCETKLFAILLGVSNSRIDISSDYTNLMCDWWPVCSIGRHQILTLQISVASHDCEMKLKSTVHFIVWVSPTVIVNTWSSSMSILPTHSINSKFHCRWHWKGHRNTYSAHQKTDIHLQAPVPLCRYKWSSGRPISEAAQHFRNLWVYEASSLWKKPFVAFLAFEAAFVYLRRSFPIRSAAVQQTHIQKKALKVGVFFFFWTHTAFVPSLVRNICVHRNFHRIYHKIFIITCSVWSKKKQCLWLPSELHCVCAYRSNFSVG